MRIYKVILPGTVQVVDGRISMTKTVLVVHFKQRAYFTPVKTSNRNDEWLHLEFNWPVSSEFCCNICMFPLISERSFGGSLSSLLIMIPPLLLIWNRMWRERNKSCSWEGERLLVSAPAPHPKSYHRIRGRLSISSWYQESTTEILNKPRPAGPAHVHLSAMSTCGMGQRN